MTRHRHREHLCVTRHPESQTRDPTKPKLYTTSGSTVQQEWMENSPKVSMTSASGATTSSALPQQKVLACSEYVDGAFAVHLCECVFRILLVRSRPWPFCQLSWSCAVPCALHRLWKQFCDVFNCMPVCAIIDEKIICMHGCLPSAAHRIL